MSAVVGLVVALVAATAPPMPSPPPTPSWNGWHWDAGTTVRVDETVSPAWRPLVAPAVAVWSTGPVGLQDSDRGNDATCQPELGGIRLCSGDYGATGWLGYTDVWVTGRRITMVRIRLNDHYFGPGSRFNTDAWRRMTLCQELGHALGLAHVDEVRDNVNLGTCMDYSATPAGGGSAGPANLAPGPGDFATLAAIYGGTLPSAIAPAAGQASQVPPTAP